MTTQRLIIRRFVPDDWAGLFEYLSDREVVRYEPYPPLTEEQCREAAASHAVSEDFWAVCLRVDGRLIGNVYLAAKEQANWELGYVFHSGHRRRGYATEAVRALLGAAFTEWGAHRVFAHCNPENTPSWRLLERLGFVREAHLRQNVYFRCDEHGAPLWQDTYEYGLLKRDWRQR